MLEDARMACIRRLPLDSVVSTRADGRPFPLYIDAFANRRLIYIGVLTARVIISKAPMKLQLPFDFPPSSSIRIRLLLQSDASMRGSLSTMSTVFLRSIHTPDTTDSRRSLGYCYCP